MTSPQYKISHSTFGDYATIYQGDVHNHQSDRCLADLRLTDPCDDKTRIQQTKGPLLREAYDWILSHPDFIAWRDDPEPRLLWIKGDPGKGKTMLLCGIIDEMEKSAVHHISYFFCQASEPNLRNATAVLRGLIYGLVVQYPSLLHHVQAKYHQAGKQLFEDVNARQALSKILTAILNDDSLQDAVLFIDALDECLEDCQLLLDFVIDISLSSPAKWVVSSRNRPEIEARLDASQQQIRLCLELNEHSISAAVHAFVQYKVEELARKMGYVSEMRKAVEHHLMTKADNTFLWVGLVCQSLENIPRRNVMKKLSVFPPGLDSLYKRMLNSILQLDDKDDASLCKEVLAVAATVYQPVTVQELCCLIGSPGDFSEDMASFEEVIRLCGSFLTIRDGTIYFIHQSAKDYLIEDKAAIPTIFPLGFKGTHHSIYSRSLEAMNKTLQKDIYSLQHPGFRVDVIQKQDPDPLAAVRYSCLYWIKHFYEAANKNHDLH